LELDTPKSGKSRSGTEKEARKPGGRFLSFRRDLSLPAQFLAFIARHHRKAEKAVQERRRKRESP
jgi:hypothetical protein